ncbi:MAG: TetR/AcrR family transcriptional regulator [Muribaculaceae bacterium]|nr:TetR/AcrR family transcriptional regulator [Bacteroides sp.]MDE6223606.1 TetR/AcrR family transcriptional regulator [Muribaculaceae bacterium]MDE6228444.1 TetR/AcrR family transcriptional regulator [Muribaculaceae bacterium]
MSDNTANTETKILEAAANEFMTKGYAGARTTAIAEAAGVTHGMLHYYFRTKEKLFDRIISDKIGLLSSMITDSITTTDSDIFELLRKVISSHLDFMTQNPLMPGFLIREMYSQPQLKELIIERVSKTMAMFINQFQMIINLNAAEGKCRAIEAKSLLLDMACLNVFPFVATPIVSPLIPEAAHFSAEFIEQRKQQNYETLANKLRL